MIDFQALNAVAIRHLPALVARWLPGGRWVNGEYVVLNPRRADRTLGSFKINRNGRWADFATTDRGGDVISLAAYLANCTQREAAKRLAAMMGMEA